jgi:hypothetical protein
MLPENRLAELGQPKLVILPAAQALTDAAWQQLLDYVSKGGTLLVSGPVSKNEHWQTMDRPGELGVKAELLPLSVRQSALVLPGQQPILVTYSGHVQQSPVSVLRFADGKSVEAVSHGNGRILWAADPVEMAEGYAQTAALYEYALHEAGVKPAFSGTLSPGVMAFPTVLDDAVLYSFSNESLEDQAVDIRDAVSGARLRFTLGAQRGGLVLVSRKDGKMIAASGAIEGMK